MSIAACSPSGSGMKAFEGTELFTKQGFLFQFLFHTPTRPLLTDFNYPNDFKIIPQVPLFDPMPPAPYLKRAAISFFSWFFWEVPNQITFPISFPPSKYKSFALWDAGPFR